MKSKLPCLSFTFCLLFVFLTGCWDSVEVEERAFNTGIAVDLAEEQGENTTYEMTTQFVVPSGLGTAGEAGGGKAFRNLQQTGESLYDINASIARQTSEKSNIEHLDVVIISKDIAEETGLFTNILDVFVRQQNMRRGILLAIGDEKAKDILNVEAEQEKVPSQYVTKLLEGNENPITTEPVRVGDIQEYLLSNRSFIIPKLSVFSKNSINYEGLAVFRGKTGQMVDSLEGEDAKGLNMIIGKNQQGSITAAVDDDQVTYSISEGSSKIKLTNKDKNNLVFQVDIDLTAQIREFNGSLDFYKRENMDKVEKVLKEEIKKIAEGSVKKVKDDLQVDVLTFGNYLRIHHYALWKEVEKDWDYGENYFAKSDININVNTNVQTPGNSIQLTEDDGGEG
ncbi:Ger(x)C family spore germination protein [Oceanobacillus rekensis]|uniref:Ger(x)C family spore germination protein n=1 Tax=Oceanobacillus rekensis TaxID=937927 RepID=UPI000B435C0A|nr:Ger(x)C family spore germination protein [Oceanobacillus rekensis]